VNNKIELSSKKKLDIVRALRARIRAIVASLLIRQARLKETLCRLEVDITP
jgi:hypothetical protein